MLAVAGDTAAVATSESCSRALLMKKMIERAQRSGIRDMPKRRDIRSSLFLELRFPAMESLLAMSVQDFRHW